MRGSQKLTIRDVARAAGVGLGTVSRVLGNAPHVSEATRHRVREAMDRLGFKPSRAAQGLARGKTDTLGVMVPFFTRHYYLEVLRGIEQAASQNDYSLIVYNIERREQALAHIEFLSKTRRVDGLIVVALSHEVVDEEAHPPLDLPIVCVDTEWPGALTVSVDHEEGMHLAVRHLAGLRHNRIALIDRPQDPISGVIGEARRSGYQRACEEAGVAAPDTYTVVAEYSEEGGYEAAARLLALSEPPTALACASDLQAIGAIRAAREDDLEVGVYVAITGYHDVDLARYVGLTTVRLPALDMGRSATEMLLTVLAGRNPQTPALRFSPELIVRQSCGARRTANSR